MNKKLNKQLSQTGVISRESDIFGNPEPIRALSWKEPFASLMLHGKIETRTWATKYRGLVLICASKKGYTEGDLIAISGESGAQRILHFLRDYSISEQSGVAIAIGRLVDCRKMKPEDEEKTFVKYRSELWCHVYDQVTPISPLGWIGSQGWGKVPEATAEHVLASAAYHGL